MHSLSLRKVKVKFFLYVALVYSLLFRFFVDYLGILSASRYIIDVCLMIVMSYSLIHPRELDIYHKKIIKFTWFYCITCVISYIFNFQSFIYMIYGIIFRFRYYVFALLLPIYFDEKDIDRCLKMLNVFFIINTIFIFYQYFVLKLYGDYLGGIFGNVQGANGYLNIFLITCITISLLKYLNKSEKLMSLLLKLVICIIISVFAELKIFFVEFIILVLGALVFSGFSWEKIIMAVGSLIVLTLGVTFFINTYDYGVTFLQVDTWIKLSTSGGYAAGYGGTGEVNRLTFISVITKKFFDNPIKKIVGVGIGNTATSTLNIFNTPFYKMYYKTRYDWFTSSSVFLELGWLGLILFISFFIIIFLYSLKIMKKEKDRRLYCYITQIMCLLSMIIFIYNNSLTMESGFLLYFVIMIPFITRKSDNS